MVTGNDFRASFGGNILRGELTSGITFNNALTEVTTGRTGGFPEYVTGKRGSVINFDNLYSFDEMEVGDSITFHIGERDNGWAGTGIIESISIQTSADDLIRHSGTVMVVGELTKFEPIIEDFVLQTRGGDDILTRSGDQILVKTQTN